MKFLSTGSVRNIFLAALVLLAGSPGEWTARANPTGYTVVQGAATFNTSGSTMTINAANNTFINWQSFNIDANETTTFVQPSSTSLVWNQINDSNPSQILGTLNANGYVVLQNPSGFYIGGQATITANGLIMTTTPTPAPNFSGGGPWSFSAPPPTIPIVNYGHININGGGSAFLIADTIENHGTISAPGGKVGLYAGQKVLVSLSPDARGLSAETTVPQGMVNNDGQLTADAGSIVMSARTVNQGGFIQANSVQNVNGTIKLVASDAVNLTSGSQISANGDSQGTSAGGSVTIQSGNTFSDQSGSAISVTGGASGGKAGQVTISAPQMSALNSTLNESANSGYADGKLSVDTSDIALNSDGSPVSGALALDVNLLSSGFSGINLQASDSIELSSLWNLAPKSGILNSILLRAGNAITVDPGAGITANAGKIQLNAGTVNENGTLQANSIQKANGVVEIDASDALSLGASSVLSAKGDSTATSPGGFVVLNSANSYADTPTSTINVSGNSGGQNGIIEILKKTGSVQSSVIGSYYAYLLDPYDMTLSSDFTDTSSSDPNLYFGDLSAYSQIDLQARDNLSVGSGWAIGNSSVGAALNLAAANNIEFFDDGDATTSDGLQVGNNWSVNLNAGGGVYLDGVSTIQAKNGDIHIEAGNEVIVGSGAIRTIAGGNIDVTAESGDVNTGTSTVGFHFSPTISPYFSPFNVSFTGFGSSTSLGGISTAAGGNVTISAGGDVISYLPTGTINALGTSDTADAGSGAFGSQPGNVTINAGGSVYGHYVVVNGTGAINAGQDVGSASDNVALSLVKGGWILDAQNGDIYLQEVRNPNGVFNSASVAATGYHRFNYDPQSWVSLNAANGGVHLTGLNVPRTSDSVYVSNPLPILLPPILDINAGGDGITLGDDFALYPSAYGDLNIVDAGDFSNGDPNGNATTLLMSDSGLNHWFSGLTAAGAKPFSTTDHGASPLEINNFDPVTIQIAGSMSDINLWTSKATLLTVDGNMSGCSFYGQNLHPDDTTSLTVGGKISNPSSFTDPVTLSDGLPDLQQLSQELGSEGVLLPPNTANLWDEALQLAVDPSKLPTQSLLGQSDLSGYISQARLLQGVDPESYVAYDPQTKKMIAVGPMPQAVRDALEKQTLTLLVYNADGTPLLDQTTGHFVIHTISWASAADASEIGDLFDASQKVPPLANSDVGYVVGGTGEFDINAGSISLGNSSGILSLGNGDHLASADYSYLTTLLQSAPAAGINIVSGTLEMPISTIAALAGGDVNITCTGADSDNVSMDLGSQDLVQFEAQIMNLDNFGLGVYTSGGGDVNVIAQGTINIDSSRIATFNGGDIFIESLNGDVNAGSGGNVAIPVNVFSPLANLAIPFEQVYANGIVAQTLVNASEVPGAAAVPGNITVKTPMGSIYANLGGILQEALNGNISAGPTITLDAGSPGYDEGDINLGDAGVIGGTVNLSATRNITGLVISRQDSDINAANNFSGTVLSGGTASLAAGGTVAGTVIGVTGVNATGGGGVTASLLGQHVSVNGGMAQSTLGTSAAATGTSQSAAVAASSQASQQVAENSGDNDKKKKKKPELRRVKRVTVILPKAS